MEGPGQTSSMTTSGAFDQLRISTVPRYEVKVSEKVEEQKEEKNEIKVPSKEEAKDTVVIIVGPLPEDKDTVVTDVEVPVADTTVVDTTRFE